jgi:hypothetical protein
MTIYCSIHLNYHTLYLVCLLTVRDSTICLMTTQQGWHTLRFTFCVNSQPPFPLRSLRIDYICLLHRRHHHIRNLIQSYTAVVRDTSWSPWSWTPRPFQGFQSQKYGHIHQHFHHCTYIKLFPLFFPRIAKKNSKTMSKTQSTTARFWIVLSPCVYQRMQIFYVCKL